LRTEHIGCAETSVTNYQPTPPNIPEWQKPQLYRCGKLESRTEPVFLPNATHVDNPAGFKVFNFIYFK